jgi:TonB family protein
VKAPSLATEIELAASRSKTAFDKCYQQAMTTGEIHGRIDIAFQVLPDGRVTHAQPVSNSTNSPQLASCLVATMVRWTFAAKPATATDFVRPFNYP